MRPKTINEEGFGGMGILRGKTSDDILEEFYNKLEEIPSDHITQGDGYDVYRLHNHKDVKHFMKHSPSTSVFKNYFVILDKSAVQESGDQLLIIAVIKDADGNIKREVKNYKGQMKNEDYLDKF